MNRSSLFWRAIFACLLGFFWGSASAQVVIEYVHTDALGSPIAISDGVGNVIEREVYEPYGAPINRAPSDQPGFTGHVEDSLTSMTYMQQRYYDPQIGRFLSVDPVTAYSNPVGAFNRYWYASNNPYRYYDPDGRCTGSRITNVDNTCASSGEFTTQAKSATSVGVRSVSSVFSHSSVSSPDPRAAPEPSSMPKPTMAAARRFLRSTVGGAVGREAVRTNQKINLMQTLPESGFLPGFSGGYDASQGGNYVAYSLDVAGFKRLNGNPGDLRGMGLDALIAHEIGHTPLGASALGYSHLPFDGSDSGEINVTRYMENAYRSEIGLDARKSYGGMPIP